MITPECPDGVPLPSDTCAWTDGVLTDEERKAKPPLPEEPPHEGQTNFNGEFIDWTDLWGYKHSTKPREAVEVFEETATRKQADDAYVARKERQQAKEQDRTDDDGWGDWKNWDANKPSPYHTSASSASASSSSWTPQSDWTPDWKRTRYESWNQKGSSKGDGRWNDRRNWR
jgi:hypothetical protein